MTRAEPESIRFFDRLTFDGFHQGFNTVFGHVEGKLGDRRILDAGFHSFGLAAAEVKTDQDHMVIQFLRS
ncbi:hypothetical protein QW131_33780 [Roseibium salinum]|nr:hypothetical protein [Roseibium salinum]